MSERFYVREHSGFTNLASRVSSTTRPQTEVMVIDRDYCHQVVRSWRRPQGTHKPVAVMLSQHRRNTEALCAELNHWHEQATL